MKNVGIKKNKRVSRSEVGNGIFELVEFFDLNSKNMQPSWSLKLSSDEPAHYLDGWQFRNGS